MAIFRQGDVLIVSVAAKPQSASEIIAPEGGRLILAHGEATGHAHAIKAEKAALFSDPKLMTIFLTVTGDETVALEHDEHSTIHIPPGDYEVIRQRQYSPEAIRRVED